MLILGDLACPNSECAEKLISDMKKSGVFQDNVVLCNLEGMLNDDEPFQDEKLFNHSKVLGAFEEGRTVFSLANNHTYDYPELMESTQKKLTKKGFLQNGICSDRSIYPVEIQEGSKSYAIFTHCWSVYTKTNPNVANQLRVIDCSYELFFNTVKKYIETNPEKKVICYFHWNYDMEVLPFPAHRELAHALIDTGVYAVVGSHSHVPQGGEIYKGRPIIYGLGNFYIPSGFFFDGKLEYPEQSKKMMVLELPKESDDAVCHWFKTDCGNAIEYLCTERLSDGEMINNFSPYKNQNCREYLDYFRNRRVKRVLVPIFRKYKGRVYQAEEYAAVARIRTVKRIKAIFHRM